MTGLTVVCVDPDADGRAATETALTDAGHDVLADESLAAVDDDALAGADCVVTEYALPDASGLDVAARLRETAPDTPCLLFTDETPDDIDTVATETVVVEYLPKSMPDARESLVRLVENVVSQRTQVGYPLPTEEDERLAALAKYDLPGLDTETAFDRLTTLAQRYFDVNVAFVGLVDAHEERFLACAGADWTTLEREDTMCTHTILEDDHMVVEDISTDPRFADSDALAALDIEAYAGVPLRTPDGTAIGAFCLTHDEPRSFSEGDVADLHRFADEAMDQLELRRRLAETEEMATDRGGGETDAGGGG
jgi:CheY-like chemotaxis protein